MSNAHPPPGTPIDYIKTAAAAIVVGDDGRILLEKRSDNGYWGLPAGALDKGETIAQTCVREVLEETGLAVHIERLLGVYSDPAIGQLIRYPDGVVAQVVAAVFICRPTGGTLAMSDESTDLQWFDPRSLPEPMTPSHRVRIDDYLSGTTTPFVR
ncbi:MAG: NUDIX domain-containing protein [Phycisphaerales bacterium]